MQTINRQTVDAMKCEHPFAAGALAASLGMGRDSYGCHFGMRSTNDRCRSEFVKGWNSCEGVAISTRRDTDEDDAASDRFHNR